MTEEIRFSEGSDYQKNVLSLVNYGLTSGQARIFLLLLESGVLTVRQIAEALRLYRVDVYRKLHELEEIGLIDVYLDSPKKYRAIEPRLAIRTLLNKVETNTTSLQKAAGPLRLSLEKYVSEGQRNLKYQSAVVNDASYKLVVGRERYYEEIKRLVRQSKMEVLRITSTNGIIRTFLPTGSYHEYLNAYKRGIKIKMISEINDNNLKYARKLSKVVQLRHLPGVRLRFTVVDRRLTILSARYDEENMSPRSVVDNFLLLTDQKFAEAVSFFFMYAWNAAKKPNF